VYLRAASSIYGIPPGKISKDQRFIGKVATLALGYQGGFRAFQKMASAYGVEIPEDLAREIVMKWRQAHPEIVSLWKAVERAFRSVLAGGSPVSYRTPLAWIQLTIRFSFKILKNGETAVVIELPSGRVLWYRHPRVAMDQTGRESLQYMSWNSVTRRYEPTGLYGGKLVENLVQAISRDFLWDALKRVDEHPETGLETLFHVHDEIVAQVPNSKAVQGVDALKNIMETLPSWTSGFRIAAEVKRASHYEK
jgi:DNA polymerase